MRTGRLPVAVATAAAALALCLLATSNIGGRQDYELLQFPQYEAVPVSADISNHCSRLFGYVTRLHMKPRMTVGFMSFQGYTQLAFAPTRNIYQPATFTSLANGHTTHVTTIVNGLGDPRTVQVMRLTVM